MSQDKNPNLKKKEELKKEAEAVVAEVQKSFVARFEEWVNGLHTGWLVAGFITFTLLAWGQDSLPAVLAAIPFGSVILNWFTDSSMGNIDEAALGLPWFLMGIELVRRARKVEWIVHAKAIASRIRTVTRRFYWRLRRLPEPEPARLDVPASSTVEK